MEDGKRASSTRMARMTRMIALRSKAARLAWLIAAAIAVVAFGGLSTPSAAAQSGADFEKEWSELAAAAKKEGQLVVSLSRMPDYQALFDIFTEKFGVRVQTQVGSGSSRVTRALAERSAGRFTVDVGLISVAASTRRLNPSGAL